MKKFTWLLLGALCLAGCAKEKMIFPRIMMTMDQLITDEEGNGEKIALYHNEEWLKWEEEDSTRVYSISSDDKYIGGALFHYETGTTDRVAYMHLDDGQEGLPEGNHYFSVFPADIGTNYSSGASLGVNNFVINLPASREYRKNIAGDSYADSSFGHNALPMVSYLNNPEPQNMEFHMVAGMMRIQFWGKDATPWKVKKITLQSVNIPGDGIHTEREGTNTLVLALSGNFNVKRLIFSNPYLAESWVGANNAAAKVSYTFKDDVARTLSSTAPGQLWTFYIPLPAQSTDKDKVTTYKLMMTLELQNNSSKDPTKKYLMKGITVDIRRQCLTMMPAIGFSDDDLSATDTWVSATGTSIGLVGNGTYKRPYRIYTAHELDLVREAFKTAAKSKTAPVINGQTVTSNTYFEIVRSDIHLVTPAQYDSIQTAEQTSNPSYQISNDNRIVQWTEGIIGFTGNMSFRTAVTGDGSGSGNNSILNTSTTPLFESITANGRIDRLQVRGNILYGGTEVFSPLCYENHGTMNDCHAKCNVTTTNANAKGLAGLCVINYGSIYGGANESPLATDGEVCGCVYINYGIVQGSFSLSSAIPVGDKIAGICMHNYGTLQYCQVESNIDPHSTGNWGVIAYYNHDSTVNGTAYHGIIDRCISSGSVVFSTTGSIGGIVHTNNSVVKNCSNKVTLRGATGNVGGIVAYMYGGEVYNSDAEGSHWIDGTGGSTLGHVAQNAGGIVGYLKAGTISNCYNQCRVDGATNSGGIVGNFDEDAVIQNAWSAFGHNFIGYNNAYGTPGEHCFSAHLDDYNKGCNTIDTSGTQKYHIHQMRPNQNQDYEGEHLIVALNAWVATHTENDYCSWTAASSTSMPRLSLPSNPTKKKTRKKK